MDRKRRQKEGKKKAKRRQMKTDVNSKQKEVKRK